MKVIIEDHKGKKNGEENQKKHSGPPPFDVLMRKFRKKCEKDGIVQEVRRRQYYEKPSAKRQKKINDFKRRIKIDKLRDIQALEAYKRSGRY